MFRKLTMMTVILLIFSYFAARGDEAAATDTRWCGILTIAPNATDSFVYSQDAEFQQRSKGTSSVLFLTYIGFQRQR